MSSKQFQRKYTQVNEVLAVLNAAKSANEGNPRWYAGELDVNGIYSNPIISFSLQDDSNDKVAFKPGMKSKRTNMRSGSNGCKYTDIYINMPDGTKIPLNITTAGDEFDICLGGIKPPDGSEELAKLQEINPEAKGRPGERDVVMLINEYDTTKIEYDEESEELIIPEGAKHSKLFQVMKIISDAIIYDTKYWVSNGKKLVDLLTAQKESNKSVTVEAVLNKYDEMYSSIRKNNYILLSTDSANEIQALFPKDFKIIMKDILILESKLTPNVCVSGDFYANRERAKNKYLKVKLMCAATGQIVPTIFDKKTSDMNGQPTVATVLNDQENEEPLTFSNIHKYVTRGSKIQGNYYTEVSVTRQGISFTLKANSMIIDHTEFKQVEFEEPSLWVPTTPVKEVAVPINADTTIKESAAVIRDDDSTDGAFDINNPSETDIFGENGLNVSSSENDLNSGSDDEK